jgi:hypothetical protein
MGATLSRSRARTVSCAIGKSVCVSLKHRLVIVSDDYTKQLHMYSLDDGSLVRSVGGAGSGAGKFHFVCGGLCVSADGDSVLVAESDNNRVQEVRVADGSWVRFVGVGALMRPQFVDCNAGFIAVSEDCHRVSVLSWCDGRVLVQFGSKGSGPGQLNRPGGAQLLGDSSGLVVTDIWNHRLCVFKLSGEFVRTLGSMEQGLSYPYDVLECASDDGSFIVANRSRNSLVTLSAAGEVVAVYGKKDSSGDDLFSPSALVALPGGGLIVRERRRLKLFPGFDLRHAWVSVCVVLSRRGPGAGAEATPALVVGGPGKCARHGPR